MRAASTPRWPETRVEDWERACEKILTFSQFVNVRRRATALARIRSRAESSRPDVSGRCATHAGTTVGEGELR
jgi:hypothetical protein